MARIDFVALQQRLAQQQPKPVPAEPLSGSARPLPASAGTLHATTTMRAALPLKGTNLRAERAEERAKANALQAQIDQLDAEMVAARAEADRELAEEQQRADRLSERVEALSAEVLRAEKQTKAAMDRAERVEAGREAERVQAETLRSSIDKLKAEQATIVEVHVRELAIARHDATAAQQAAAEFQQAAEAARQARGRWARLRAAWRGA